MLAYKATLTSVIALVLLVSITANAQDYEILFYTIDGGGNLFTSGGEFELSGTIGQPDAGSVMTGGEFAVTGGFWVETIVTPPCEGDLDGDGDTDQSDLGILLSAWGIDAGGDLDGDGDTDQADLGILLADWGCGT